MTEQKTTLSMVRFHVDKMALHQFAARQKLLDDDLGYALHIALRRRFGACSPQPFSVQGPTEHREDAKLTVLGYTADAEGVRSALACEYEGVLPDWRREWSDDPLASLITAPAQIKTMPSQWSNGTPLAFQVKLRPVRRATAGVRERHGDDVASGKRAAGERDAFLSALDESASADGTLDREHVYARWLAERLAPAATLAPGACLEAFRRTRVRRSRHDGVRTREVEGPEALMSGQLRVEDGAEFARLLARGVGRHVAFGYGMLLLSPAGDG